RPKPASGIPRTSVPALPVLRRTLHPNTGFEPYSSLASGLSLSRTGCGRTWLRLGLGRRGVAADVDPPPGEPRGQAGVLPFLADGERQLEVRHHDAGRLRAIIHHLYRYNLGGREGIPDEP